MSDGLVISGGPIENFAGGIAKIPFGGECAHYWIEVTEECVPVIGKFGRARYWESACGKAEAVTHDAVHALNPVNWKVCKLCQKKMEKAA